MRNIAIPLQVGNQRTDTSDVLAARGDDDAEGSPKFNAIQRGRRADENQMAISFQSRQPSLMIAAITVAAIRDR
jgi:hypothetical protein